MTARGKAIVKWLSDHGVAASRLSMTVVRRAQGDDANRVFLIEFN